MLAGVRTRKEIRGWSAFADHDVKKDDRGGLEMAAYIIVQENLHGDQAPFEEYRRQVIATFTPYGGKFLARGGKVSVLEGEWPYDRSVILEFPSREAAEKWYHSPEYQKILPLRMKSVSSNFVIMDGV
jgi:uncharacterized protein (DUF1330 family)